MVEIEYLNIKIEMRTERIKIKRLITCAYPIINNSSNAIVWIPINLYLACICFLNMITTSPSLSLKSRIFWEVGDSGNEDMDILDREEELLWIGDSISSALSETGLA